MSPVNQGFSYAMVLEYDGSCFFGFQIQDRGPTVQSELERALKILFKQDIRIAGSGRTDSGVHATGQVAGFTLSEPIENPEKILRSINGIVDRGLSVRSLFPVPEWFHPRFSCLAREYEYLIWNSPVRPVHLKGKTLHVRTPMDVESLHGELQEIRGERDFVAFTREEYREENTFRYLDLIELREAQDPFWDGNLLIFKVRGNAFLHNMIRILVGTLVARAEGKVQDSFFSIQQSLNRKKSGPTAIPDGLFFRRAYYPCIESISVLPCIPDYPVFAPRALPG